MATMGQNFSPGQQGEEVWEGDDGIQERSQPQHTTSHPHPPSAATTGHTPAQPLSSLSPSLSPNLSGHRLGIDPVHSLSELMAHQSPLWEAVHRNLQQRMVNGGINIAMETGSQSDNGPDANISTPNRTAFAPRVESRGQILRPLAADLRSEQNPRILSVRRLQRHPIRFVRATHPTELPPPAPPPLHSPAETTETPYTNFPGTTMFGSGDRPGGAALEQLFMSAADAAIHQTERWHQEFSNAASSQATGLAAAATATTFPSTHLSSTPDRVNFMLRQTSNTSRSSMSQTSNATDRNYSDNTVNARVREAFECFLSSFRPEHSDANDVNGSPSRLVPPDNFVRIFRLDNHHHVSVNTDHNGDTENGVTDTSRQETTETSTIPTPPTAARANENSTTHSTNSPRVPSLVPTIIVGVRSLSQASVGAAQRSLANSRHSHHVNANAFASNTGTPSTTNTTPRRQNTPTSNTSTTNGGSRGRGGGRGGSGGRLPSSQFWLIYIVGYVYPSNHPILRMSELNLSENATYEDLIRLSEFIGPARPIKVTQADIDAAGLKVHTLNAMDLVGQKETEGVGKGKRIASAPTHRDTSSSSTTTTTTTTTGRPIRQTRKRQRSSESNPNADSTATHRHCHRQRRRRLSNRRELLTGDQCIVCLSEWAIGDVVRFLHCRHSFHRDCVDRWLQEGADHCPVCRATVVRRTDTSTNKESRSSSGESVTATSR